MAWDTLREIYPKNESDQCSSSSSGHSGCVCHSHGKELCHAHGEIIVKTIVEKHVTSTSGYDPGPIGFTLTRSENVFTSITYDDGLNLNLNYEKDRLSSIQDSLGNTMTMVYDDEGYLMSGVVS